MDSKMSQESFCMSKFTLETHSRKIVTPLMFSSYVFSFADEGNNVFDFCYQSETALAICDKNTDENDKETTLIEFASMCFNSISVDSFTRMPEKSYSEKNRRCIHFQLETTYAVGSKIPSNSLCVFCSMLYTEKIWLLKFFTIFHFHDISRYFHENIFHDIEIWRHEILMYFKKS